MTILAPSGSSDYISEGLTLVVIDPLPFVVEVSDQGTARRKEPSVLPVSDRLACNLEEPFPVRAEVPDRLLVQSVPPRHSHSGFVSRLVDPDVAELEAAAANDHAMIVARNGVLY